MHVWYGKAAVLAASAVMIAIRAPHGQRSRSVVVERDCRGPVEKALLAVAMVSFFVPLVWIASPAFGFADYALSPAAWGAGVVCLALGLWMFHRSHADLGTNWSVTLQVREGHTLVTGGVYAYVRHPMYSALFLYSAGQALAAPNWIAGPSYLAAMVPLIATRLGAEERMMRDRFGAEWDAYAARTRRLVPGVF